MSRAERLLKLLWEQYKKDCPHAQAACDIFGEENIVHDHIAFRTVNHCGKLKNPVDPPYDGADYNPHELRHGIDPIEAIWGHLGWRRAGCYGIGSKNIWAIHMDPPNEGLPKIFISEYETQKIKDKTGSGKYGIRALIEKHMGQPVETIPGGGPKNLSAEELFTFFNTSVYPGVPSQGELDFLEEQSQYVAWVRVFGRKVNHFTMLVNALPPEPIGYGDEDGGCGPMKYRDQSISDVWHLLENAEIPMKRTIEGEGSELAQTSTAAAPATVPILCGGGEIKYVERPYAYYEIAQRGMIRFEGFKAEQTHGLFDMTGR